MTKSNSLHKLSVQGSANDECKEFLEDVIGQQLIPRLLNSQNYSELLTSPEVSGASAQALPEFNAFINACKQGDSLHVNQIVDTLISQGFTQESVFLDLITPAARQLGALWDKDLCSFTDVTCGLAMMHHVIYRLGYEFRDGPHVKGEQTSVMMCCAPGSMHLLGVTIVGDLFRREGANVVIEVSSTEQELVRAVANEWFDVIGISVAIESQLLDLKTLVRALKSNSGNPNVKVLLGGPIFMLVNATEDMFGADLIAKNAHDAVALLKSFAAK
jgi:methanogenic corrinoid protein MtbC1